MTGLIHFSTDPASNDVAAPPILWIEGQPAKTINNSAREVMAAQAKWHADTIGSLGTTGAETNALQIATAQGIADLDRAFGLAFQANAQNTGPCTLNADGSGARPIRRPGNIELAPGDIVSGLPFSVVWLPNLACYTVTSPHIARPGRIEGFGTEAAIPPGWVLCDGRALSRTAYAALFFFLGGTHGLPDDNTFRVPDLRGRAMFGVDGGVGRLTGAGGLAGALASVGGAEAVGLTEAQLASHAHGGSTGGAGAHDHGGATVQGGQHNHGGGTGQAGGHAHTGTTDGGGAHAHTGTTDNAGVHRHGIGYRLLSNYRTDAQSGGVSQLDQNDNNTNVTGYSDLSGGHTHALTINGVGDHQHAFTTAGVGNHAHGIPDSGEHAHGIPGVGDHTHGVSITAAGGGQAHPNMPPGLVVIFAIKA